ncbi:Clp protease N-terminal domain-containing protein [Phytomonospora sp. NPDC050363]|uniref:Clp protease N-terminal domain-containing protein n=1 Tax=Phytomonospora sp. NPDC050363 TaxID=3155642 RepID=UPI00340A3369
MSPIDEYLHAIIDRAGQEAHDDGSSAVEAHHLLLAVAAQPEPVVGPLLHDAGLDRQAVHDALRREYEHSLSTVGVNLASFDLAPPTRTPKRSLKIGATAKGVLERGFATARKKDLRPAHLLLAILRIQNGTVPRALAIAGVDTTALVERVSRTVGA